MQIQSLYLNSECWQILTSTICSGGNLFRCLSAYFSFSLILFWDLLLHNQIFCHYFHSILICLRGSTYFTLHQGWIVFTGARLRPHLLLLSFQHHSNPHWMKKTSSFVLHSSALKYLRKSIIQEIFNIHSLDQILKTQFVEIDKSSIISTARTSPDPLLIQSTLPEIIDFFKRNEEQVQLETIRNNLLSTGHQPALAKRRIDSRFDLKKK